MLQVKTLAVTVKKSATLIRHCDHVSHHYGYVEELSFPVRIKLSIPVMIHLSIRELKVEITNW